MSLLILPGTELFDKTLSNSFLYLQNSALMDSQNAVIQDASTGLYRSATAQEVFDYIYGGEYDETLETFGDES